jgi:hypothetical protein
MGPPHWAGLSRRPWGGVDASLRRLRTDYRLAQVHFWDEVVPIDETLDALDAVRAAGSLPGRLELRRVAARAGLRAAAGGRSRALRRAQNSTARGPAASAGAPSGAGAGRTVALEPAGRAGVEWQVSFGRGAPPGRAAQTGWNFAARLTPRAYVVLGEYARSRARPHGRPGRPELGVARPRVAAPLVGARTPAQLEESLVALDWALDDDDRAVLDAASAPHLGYRAHGWTARHPGPGWLKIAWRKCARVVE